MLGARTSVPLNARPVASRRPDSQTFDAEGAVQQLKASMPAAVGNLDFPFSEAELTWLALRSASKLWMHACAPRCWYFFQLLRSWSIVPTVWRSAIVAPVHKGRTAEKFTIYIGHYRPISWLCSCQEVFERLVLKRLLPHVVGPLLDESQAGFRVGLRNGSTRCKKLCVSCARRRRFCA